MSASPAGSLRCVVTTCALALAWILAAAAWPVAPARAEAPSPEMDGTPAMPEAPEAGEAAASPPLPTGPDPDAPQATVTLIGGAQLTGGLLRHNDAGVAIDLGHDVVHVPAAHVLDVRAHDSAEAEPSTVSDHELYQVGSLDPAPIPRLVERYGDAVVTLRTAAGVGSGFLISEQGHLITNYHVIENETTLSVTVFKRTNGAFEKQETRQVRVLALHPLRDLALLQLDLDDLDDYSPTPLVIAENADIAVGDMVFTIGNPLGLERSVTQGIISSTTRTLEHLRMFQTDASINPGNSGGPLLNGRGEVVGVVCAGATAFDGLAFGIPASDLLDFLRNREAYLYDPSQPQNGVKYLPPPFRSPTDEARNERNEQDEPEEQAAGEETSEDA